MENPLRPEDFQTGCWKRLAAAVENKLDELREKNDARLDPGETAFLRGRIATLKTILGLAKASPGSEAGPQWIEDLPQPGDQQPAEFPESGFGY